MRSSTIRFLWIVSSALLLVAIVTPLGKHWLSSRRRIEFLSGVKDARSEIKTLVLERLFERIELNKTAGLWRMTVPENFPVIQTVADDMIGALAAASIEEKITDRRERFKDFELDDARSVRFSAKNAAGRSVTAGRLGKQVQGSWDRTYFAFEGSSSVYIVRGLARYQMDKTAKDLKSRLIWEIAKDKIIRIELEHGKKSLKFEFYGGTWTFRGRPGNQEKISEITGGLASLEATDFPESFELASGLLKLGVEGKRPKTLVIKVVTADGAVYELWIGEKKETMYFAKRVDRPVVWKLAEWKVTPWLAKESDFAALKKK